MGEEHHPRGKTFKDATFWTLLVFQAVMFVLYISVLDYDTELMSAKTTASASAQASFSAVYPFYQDVHIMIFIGFGFLMTFLRRYGYSSVGYNYLLAAMAIEWYLLTHGFFAQAWDKSWHKVAVSLPDMVNADFSAGAVLITFGAILGKTTPIQLLWVVIVEVALYAAHEQLLLTTYKINDIGGTLIIHTFGAYFGLSLSRVLAPTNHVIARGDYDNKAVYHSDLFSMIGTIFLWCFWPSFNGALAGLDANAQPRAVLNTLLSLCAATIVAFAWSRYLRNGKFEMVDVQNATLAGGVAVGAAANLPLHPWGAFIVGSAAATISTFGFAVLQPLLQQYAGLHDTCGVHNLHGMPGVFGGLVAVVAAGGIQDSDYGSPTTLGIFFPERLNGRSQSSQAWYQLAALASTLAIAIVGGSLTGLFLRSPLFEQPIKVFNDSEFWHVPSEELPYFHSDSSAASRGDIELAQSFPPSSSTGQPGLQKLQAAYDSLDTTKQYHH